MNTLLWRLLSFASVLLLVGLLSHPPQSAAAAVTDAGTSAASDVEDQHDESEWRDDEPAHGRHHQGDALVSIGHDSHLLAGRHADAVVSILGSSQSEGDADNVVSVLGDTRVVGPVKDSAVAVLGNVYIDSKVAGNAVAVLGNVELGPHAEIGGNVTSVLGTILRDPAAIVHGGEENIFAGALGDIAWLRTWVRHCLIYGRPLSFAPGLGWAWTLAIAFLALYFGLALLFRPALSRCVETVESQPGRTAVAALLTMLLIPVLLVLLCVSVVGIAVIPFVLGALLCAALFGKAVMLASIGRRVVSQRSGPFGHPAFAVLLGGIIVLALYLVPVLGFIVYKLLGLFGLGAIAHTLILRLRAHQSAIRPVDPTPQAASTLPHAGFWIRMGALLLDILLIGFMLSLLHPLRHVHLLVLAAYGAVMWKLRGSTLGGIIFDLRVVRVDGRAIDWETAIVRALGCFLSLAVVGLGFIWIAFDDSRQAWHDKIAGTMVVRVPKGVPPP
jgi:uncharacterized RDD family membrane protein YckC